MIAHQLSAYLRSWGWGPPKPVPDPPKPKFAWLVAPIEKALSTPIPAFWDGEGIK